MLKNRSWLPVSTPPEYRVRAMYEESSDAAHPLQFPLEGGQGMAQRWYLPLLIVLGLSSVAGALMSDSGACSSCRAAGNSDGSSEMTYCGGRQVV